jgi:hypothetical protein
LNLTILLIDFEIMPFNPIDRAVPSGFWQGRGPKKIWAPSHLGPPPKKNFPETKKFFRKILGKGGRSQNVFEH